MDLASNTSVAHIHRPAWSAQERTTTGFSLIHENLTDMYLERQLAWQLSHADGVIREMILEDYSHITNTVRGGLTD